MTSTAEILKAARKLIEKPENWTQGAYARDGNGRSELPSRPEAVCFCSIGAISVAGDIFIGGYVLNEEMKFAFSVESEGELAYFNDSRTHSEVLDLFSKAIAAAEASS